MHGFKTLTAATAVTLALQGCAVTVGGADTTTGGVISFVPGVPEDPAPAGSQDNVQFAVLLNDERGRVTLQPVVFDQTLTDVAQAHATDMAENDYFSHTGRNGSTLADRIDASGYQYDWAAENILQGTADEALAVQTWMNSPSHRDAMLDPRAEEFGLGLDDDIYVLVLADPAGS